MSGKQRSTLESPASGTGMVFPNAAGRGADRQEYTNAAGARRNTGKTDSGGAGTERRSTREIDEEALPPRRAAPP
jgi:hypothetical protein